MRFNMSHSGINVLVSGSQKLDDSAFVKNTLNTFFMQTNGNIQSVFTSRFSGACAYAAEWVKEQNILLPPDKKIALKDCTFDFHLTKKNQSLYEQLDIPEFILRNDPFFQDGKSLLISNKINLVMAFPNPEGKLGPSTQNIQRFAELAQIPVFDCSVILAKMNELKESVKQHKEPTSKLMSANKHPMRKP